MHILIICQIYQSPRVSCLSVFSSREAYETPIAIIPIIEGDSEKRSSWNNLEAISPSSIFFILNSWPVLSSLAFLFLIMSLHHFFG
jgi:hypothetical protein